MRPAVIAQCAVQSGQRRTQVVALRMSARHVWRGGPDRQCPGGRQGVLVSGSGRRRQPRADQEDISLLPQSLAFPDDP